MNTKSKILFLAFAVSLIVSSFAYAETAKVIVKESAIREKCRFFSPSKVKVRYNDSLEIISQEGDWFRVKFRNTQGCIHKSAIEEKKFRLSGILGSQPQGATGDEVSLAGKGFNPQVEKSYKGKHPELDFGLVDRIENFEVSEENLNRFIRNGGLNLPE